MRTALNDIQGFSTLLYNDQVGKLTNEQKKYLYIILNSSHSIVKLMQYLSDKQAIFTYVQASKNNGQI
jgi:hypothetical protein